MNRGAWWAKSPRGHKRVGHYLVTKQQQCRRRKSCALDPWVRKIPWSRKWKPTPVLSPGKSHGQRSLAGCNPWNRKESDTTERLSMHKH